MPDQHNTQSAGSKGRLRSRVRHASEVTVHRLHELEHTAADAYHALEDHNPRELLHDIRWLLQRFSAWLLPHIGQFKAWYLAHDTVLRIVYGLTLVPVVLVLGLLGLIVVKFGGPLLCAGALVLQIVLLVSKTLLFIGYIGYKIVKTLLMWYITISRLYLGGKAKRARRTLALCGGFKVDPESEASRMNYHCQRKELAITHQRRGQLIVLFSYLRYALRGQRELWRHVRRRWSHYLTLWRQSSRDLIKQELAPVGVSMFAPHQLGAGLEVDKILVPGDAELELIELNENGEVWLYFLIRWVEWQFEWRRAMPFLAIRRQHKQMPWQVEARFQAVPSVPVTSTA
ncbi:MAG: hypothetical protein R3F53_08655 [Gammaproteobacteria bacterium]